MKSFIPNDALIHFLDLVVKSRRESNAILTTNDTKKYMNNLISLRNEVMRDMLVGRYDNMDKIIRQSFYLIFNETRYADNPNKVLNNDGLYMFGNDILSLTKNMRAAVARNNNNEIKSIAMRVINIVRNISPLVIGQNKYGEISYQHIDEDFENLFRFFKETIIQSVHNFIQYEELKYTSSNHRRIMGHGWVAIRSAMLYCGYWRSLLFASNIDQPESISDDEKRRHVVSQENHYWSTQLSIKKIKKIINQQS